MSIVPSHPMEGPVAYVLAAKRRMTYSGDVREGHGESTG